MLISRCASRRWRRLLLVLAGLFLALTNLSAETGLLFHVSADKGATADFSAGGTPEPTFLSEVQVIPDGAKGPALSCGNVQRLAWKAPGNIRAQRGTLSFFWRSRYPVGPTEFPIFRVAYADHSSWDMVWLRIDYNGHGFDAFVTDANLARTRVSVALPGFPQPTEWVHLTLAWDETRGIRFYVNGQLVAKKETVAVYDAALDQFGPHSRIISPYNVQSDYNFVRGGDIDEIRIYDRMLDDEAVASLARGETPADLAPQFVRDLSVKTWRDEWWFRYGWNRNDDPPPALTARNVSVRKVEIHDAYDMKRWWWKANDGIRETTWPGVYNRSKLPGRHDYFELPDWDCYSTSGKSVTFALPDEPWNHLEISGAAWGKMELLPKGTPLETAYEARAESILFERPKGQEKTVHVVAAALAGREIRFTNVEQEEPIGELSAYNVTAGSEPAKGHAVSFQLGYGAGGNTFVNGRFADDERASLIARPEGDSSAVSSSGPSVGKQLPIVHVSFPVSSDESNEGLDGIAIDLPAFNFKPTHGELIPFNLQVQDPLWPLRRMFDFSFSVKAGEAHTLWLDLRDRILPAGRPLGFTIASASDEFDASSLLGAKVRLVFKSREAARAEHEIDRFTQARDGYAMLVEEHPFSPKFDLWVRFEGDLKDLLRVNPGHRLGREYAWQAMGAPPPPLERPEPPAGMPRWAFYQAEALKGAQHFANWWIDHRQIDNGEFGGGLSDDTDLTNLWPGIALMGCEPKKIAESLRKELDACYAQGMFTRGLPTIQADELHSYEEGINALGENLILNYGSPRQIERAMENVRGVESITGVNEAGHRHIRSSYYSGTRVAEEEPWGYAKANSYLVLQPGQLLVDYNGSPSARKVLIELADGLLAHRHQDAKGKYVLPTAIHFKTDANSDATRSYLPWPLFWSSWKWTGDKRYLEPIFDGGTTALMAVNANALDLLSLRSTWGPKIMEEDKRVSAAGRITNGRGSPRPSTDRSSQVAHLQWQVSGDKHLVETLYGNQIEEMALGDYINTEGSLWIDRVGVPTTELQRARLGGVALVRGGTFPGHVVSWKFHAPAKATDIAILIPNATATNFKVIAYNLAESPVSATLTGWNIDPGMWEVTQGADADGDDAVDGATTSSVQPFGRTQSVELTFAPRTTTVLTFKLAKPGTPYWQRPDLGIDPEDVRLDGDKVHVTVHSLGSVPAPATEIVWRAQDGRIVSRGTISALAAPVDLLPRTAEVTLALPKGAAVAGGTIEIDPSHTLEEITLLNNRVTLPSATPSR